jgi:hypothetical protein
MSEQYLTEYTYEEISEILKTIQTCVAGDKFIISQNTNRRENTEFIQRYNLTVAKVKGIISMIETDDFCYGLNNKNPGFEHEVLYVFCPQIELAYGDAVEAVDIYSKFNIIDNERVVVISFHRRNYPIDYLFKNSGAGGASNE